MAGDSARQKDGCKYIVYINRNLSRALVAAISIQIVFSLESNAADVRYNVLHLQDAYGAGSLFTDLSPGGVISGASPEGLLLVRDGESTTIPFPFGPNGAQHSAFNDGGVAYVVPRGFDGVYTLDDSGTLTNTGYIPRGTSMTLGRQNSLSEIVAGEEGGSIPGLSGFIYSPVTGGEGVDTLGGVRVTRFSAINNDGWIIGNGIASTANGSISGMFLWIPGEDGLLLAPGFGEPEGINDFGQVIGAQGAGAFFWDEGDLQFISDVFSPDPLNPEQMINLTVLGGAFGINNHGEVTGFSSIRPEFGYDGPTGLNGWLWTDDEGLLFLDDLVDPTDAYHFTGGLAIAEDGSILTAGSIPGNDEVQHFLLTPIPEPGAFILVVTGISLATLRKRSRHRGGLPRDV